MKRIIATVALACLSVQLAFAEDAKPKIIIRDALALQTALQALDGHQVIVKGPNGADAIVTLPWEFGDATLRLKIVNDLNIVVAAIKSAQQVQQALTKEATTKAEVTELKDLKPEDVVVFNKQIEDLMTQPAAGTQDLARIKASELKLGKNEIPGSILSALSPILDLDK